jgi:hypothetical protein
VRAVFANVMKEYKLFVSADVVDLNKKLVAAHAAPVH